MSFDVVFLLALILIMLFGIAAVIMAYPGPKKSHR